MMKQKMEPDPKWYAKAKAAAKREGAWMKAPGSIRSVGDPYVDGGGIIIGPKAKVIKKGRDQIAKVATAIGIKSGILPIDMTGWSARPGVEFKGECNVFFSPEKNAKPIVVTVKNLDWVPAEPIEEITEEPAIELAMAA